MRFMQVTAPAAMLAAVLLAACGGGGDGGGRTTPPVVGFNIVAAGDIAQCGDGPAAASGAARTAALVAAQDALVLTLGDNAYQDGTATEFANCNSDIARLGLNLSRLVTRPPNSDEKSTCSVFVEPPFRG